MRPDQRTLVVLAARHTASIETSEEAAAARAFQCWALGLFDDRIHTMSPESSCYSISLTIYIPSPILQASSFKSNHACRDYLSYVSTVNVNASAENIFRTIGPA